MAYGRNLVEVFSVRAVGGAARPPPCGSVNVFDGRRGQIIYSHGGEQQRTPIHSSSHAQDALLLTGPYRAISADGSVAFELDLHDPSSQEQQQAPSPHEEVQPGIVSWDIYDPSTEYDKPISRTAGTRHGPVEVTFAVLSNAVEATVEVALVRGGGEEEEGGDDGGPAAAACGVNGSIIARSQMFDIGTVLFDGELGRRSSDDESPGPGEKTAVPLARSVLAVPLGWPLTVEADLCARSGDEIVRGSLEFHPEVEGQHVQLLGGKNGAIEVTVTWLND